MQERPELYVTFDLRSEPQVRRIFIPGNIKGWRVGTFETRTGEKNFGVKIRYRAETQSASSEEIVRVPDEAENVQLRIGLLPSRYQLDN